MVPYPNIGYYDPIWSPNSWDASAHLAFFSSVITLIRRLYSSCCSKSCRENVAHVVTNMMWATNHLWIFVWKMLLTQYWIDIHYWYHLVASPRVLRDHFSCWNLHGSLLSWANMVPLGGQHWYMVTSSICDVSLETTGGLCFGTTLFGGFYG